MERIGAWDRDRTADPHLATYPTGTTPPDDVTGRLITKPEFRLYLSYDRP